MNNRMLSRVCALEGNARHFTMGELLDHLDGVPLPVGKVCDPAMIGAFVQMGSGLDA